MSHQTFTFSSVPHNDFPRSPIREVSDYKGQRGGGSEKGRLSFQPPPQPSVTVGSSLVLRVSFMQLCPSLSFAQSSHPQPHKRALGFWKPIMGHFGWSIVHRKHGHLCPSPCFEVYEIQLLLMEKLPQQQLKLTTMLGCEPWGQLEETPSTSREGQPHL